LPGLDSYLFECIFTRRSKLDSEQAYHEEKASGNAHRGKKDVPKEVLLFQGLLYESQNRGGVCLPQSGRLYGQFVFGLQVTQIRLTSLLCF